MLGTLFNTVLYEPLFNLLVFFYNVLPGHDLGVAIIVLTVAVRLLLYPLSARSIKAQKALQQMQPAIDQIRKKYKNDKEQTSRATLEFYRKNKINPLSSCLPLLIQLPIMLAIYQILRDGVGNPEKLNLLYSFIENPGVLNPTFLGLVDLSQRSIYLAILAGLSQFWQSRMLLTQRKKGKTESKIKSEGIGEMAKTMSNQMVYIMPIFTVIIALSLPAGLSFYWLITTLFSIAQQWIIMKKNKKSAGSPKQSAD